MPQVPCARRSRQEPSILWTSDINRERKLAEVVEQLVAAVATARESGAKTRMKADRQSNAGC